MLKKITIELGQMEVEFSYEDARKLYSALHELFGSKKTEYIPIPQPYPVIQPRPAPYWGPSWTARDSSSIALSTNLKNSLYKTSTGSCTVDPSYKTK